MSTLDSLPREDIGDLGSFHDVIAPSVLIVGGGFSGVSVAMRMHAYSRGPVSILLVDGSGRFGTGLAYSNKDMLLTMSGRAGRLSAFEEAPNHFVEWLRNEKACRPLSNLPELANGDFAPRRLYGDYLRYVLSKYSQPSPYGAHLKMLPYRLTDIEGTCGVFRASFENGPEVMVEGIVLATGNPPPRRLAPELSSCECIEDPWDVETLCTISAQARVLLVGSGQTMMDVAQVLATRQHKSEIYVVSRRGLIGHPHSGAEIGYTVDTDRLPADLRGMLKWLRKEAQQWMAGGGDWRAVMNSLRPHTQRLWMGFSLAEKRRFLEHLAPYWRIHRTRVPPELSSLINALLASEQMRSLAGRLRKIQRGCNGLRAVIDLRGKNQPSTIEVDRIVNCTGPNYDCRVSDDVLIGRLLRKGMLDSHPSGLGFNVTPDGRVIDHSGEISSRMFAVGPPCQGTLLEITVIREIRQQAAAVAAQLLRAVFGNESAALVRPMLVEDGW